jgi:hypothetical protein
LGLEDFGSDAVQGVAEDPAQAADRVFAGVFGLVGYAADLAGERGGQVLKVGDQVGAGVAAVLAVPT